MGLDSTWHHCTLKLIGVRNAYAAYKAYATTGRDFPMITSRKALHPLRNALVGRSSIQVLIDVVGGERCLSDFPFLGAQITLCL